MQKILIQILNLRHPGLKSSISGSDSARPIIQKMTPVLPLNLAVLIAL
jgi:hypothetical protein